MTTRPQKITFGEMREMGIRDVLVHCDDYRCSHHTEMNADQWADDVRLSDIEDKFTCNACGKRGAEVRPDFRREGGLVDTAITSAPVVGFTVQTASPQRTGRELADDHDVELWRFDRKIAVILAGVAQRSLVERFAAAQCCQEL